ncbi:MAG TPA: MFS transporter [Thermodesulfobacteriota bacterium]
MSEDPVTDPPAPSGPLPRVLRRVVDVRPGEAPALAWAWVYFFSILSAYYVIRPIRDEAGVAGGVANLPWLFTGTLVAMAAANPLFGLLVSRLARVRFIAVTYRFFMANLVLFLALFVLSTGAVHAWVGRAFYVWTAVFNLFVVSIFWALMVDVFDSGQSRRLFGFIAAGGTLGGIAGSLLTSTLVGLLGPAALLLLSVVLLEVAVLSVRRLSRLSHRLHDAREAGDPDAAAIGGSALAGLVQAVRSPYLLNISLYMLLFTVLSTFLYFQQASIVAESFADRAARTVFFANVDLAVNTLTLLAQVFVTGRVLAALGVALTLTLLPALSVLGFLALGVAPTLAVIVAFQVLRRAGNFAVARPTREILFTVLGREDKYKAKSFIDTFVYRAGDQAGAWSYALMGLLGLGVSGIGLVAVPISLAWLLNALWLGRRQEAMARGDRPTGRR